jgi:ABC-type spermidine/putrescine transport system permease subunit II
MFGAVLPGRGRHILLREVVWATGLFLYLPISVFVLVIFSCKMNYFKYNVVSKLIQ